MQEAFLHFIWKYQYFDKSNLVTTSGQKVNIIKPGFGNTDAGPDFGEAHIQLADLEWRGSVEMHINSSYWDHHGHDTDPTYENVVLHVVWKHDIEVIRKDGSRIPVLVLEDRVDEKLLHDYKRLTQSVEPVPCARQLNDISTITVFSMLEKSVSERLMRKANEVLDIIESNSGDWEETLYQVLAKNFGFKVNAEPFSILSRSISYKILRKHSSNLMQIEALLYGQAGYLEEDRLDEYHQKLKKEYDFLAHKYTLTLRLARLQWKMMRLRPANFPTLRVAQFAAIINQKKSLFAFLIGCNSTKDLKSFLNAEPSAYWQSHYDFDKPANKIPSLGNNSLDNVIINTIAPLLVAYGKYHDNQEYTDRAIQFLQEVKPENNKITRLWGDLPVSIQSGFDSQALIELYNNYCSRKKCLNCAIGVEIINKK